MQGIMCVRGKEGGPTTSLNLCGESKKVEKKSFHGRFVSQMGCTASHSETKADVNRRASQ